MDNSLKEAFKKASPAEIEEFLSPLGVKTFPELYKKVHTPVAENQNAGAKQLEEMEKVAKEGAKKQLVEAGIEATPELLESYIALPESNRPAFIKAFLNKPVSTTAGTIVTESVEDKTIKDETAKLFGVK